jgi:hypothetical protein
VLEVTKTEEIRLPILKATSNEDEGEDIVSGFLNLQTNKEDDH